MGINKATGIFGLSILLMLFFSASAYASPSANTVSYIPITISNLQNQPTPVPFQQMISINSLSYNLSSSFQNLEFIYSNGNVIPSWLESNSNSIGIFWIKLTSPINANSNTIIYAKVYNNRTSVLNGNTVGESPWITGPSSPASLDNGQNVFNIYGYFANNAIPANWTTQNVISETQSGGLQLVSHGVYYDSGAVIFKNSFTTQNQIIELGGQYNGTSSPLADNLGIGIYSSGMKGLTLNNNSINSANDAYTNSGCVNPAPIQGYYISYQFYPNSVANAANKPGVLFNSPHTAYCSSSGSQIENLTYAQNDILPDSGNNYLFTQTIFTSNYISMKFATNPSDSYAPIYSGLENILNYTSPNSLIVPNSTFYVAGSDGSANSNIYLDWVRVRSYPVNGIMPTATNGNLIAQLTVSTPSPNSIIYQGQSAAISSSVSGGISPYTYQWLVESPGATQFNSTEANSICGSSSNTLSCIFQTSSSTLLGKYKFELQVSDSAPDSNTIISSPGSITVVAPFMIAITNVTGTSTPFKPVTSINIDQGYDLIITNVTPASGGTPPYHYQWLAAAPGSNTLSATSANTLCQSPQSHICNFNTNSITTTGKYVFALFVTDSSTALPRETVLSNNVIVNVNTALTVPPTITNTPIVDEGQNIYLTSNLPSDGTPTYYYTWEVSNVLYQPSGYPLFSDLASNSVCPNGSGQMNATESCIIPAPSLISTNAGAVTPTFPLRTGNYLFRITLMDSSTGVTHTAEFSYPANVAVYPMPNITLASNSVIDLGQSVNISAILGGGVGPFNVNISSGNTIVYAANSLSSGNTIIYTFTPNSVGTYNFTALATDKGTSNPYTFKSDKISIIVKNAPTVSIDEHSSLIDEGQPIALIAVVNGGTGKYAYQWYSGSITPSNEISGANSMIYYQTPNSIGTFNYSVKVTDLGTASPFIFTSNATITVDTSPTVTITPSSSSITQGNTQLLTGKVTGGTGNFVYTWYNFTGTPTKISGSGNTYTFDGTNTGTFYYELTVSDVGTEASISPTSSNTASTFVLNDPNSDYVWNANVPYGSWSARSSNAFQGFNTIEITTANTLLTSIDGYSSNAIGNNVTFVEKNGIWDMNPSIISYVGSNSNTYLDYWTGAFSFNGAPSNDVISGALLRYTYLDLPQSASANVLADYPNAIYDVNISMWKISEYVYLFGDQANTQLPFVIGEPLTIPIATSNTASVNVTTAPKNNTPPSNPTPPPTGGGPSGGGGGGVHRPSIFQTSNNCYTVSSITQLNTFTIAFGNEEFNFTENFIGPTDAGVSVNGNAFTLTPNETVTFFSHAKNYYTMKLLNISYLPLENTIMLEICSNTKPIPNKPAPSEILNLTINNSNVTLTSNKNNTIEILMNGTEARSGTKNITFNTINLSIGTYVFQGRDIVTGALTGNETFTVFGQYPILTFIKGCSTYNYTANSLCTTEAEINTPNNQINGTLYLNGVKIGSTDTTINYTISKPGNYLYVFNTTGNYRFYPASINYSYDVRNVSSTFASSGNGATTPAILAVLIAIMTGIAYNRTIANRRHR